MQIKLKVKVKMKYIIGLDCGIASVGWSVVSLENNQIVDFRIRTFSAPEDPKTGELYSKTRQDQLGKMRNIRRKSHRIIRLKRLLKSNGLPHNSTHNNVWQIRYKALDNLITDSEFSAILLHMIKNRGPILQRIGEEGAILSSVSNNHELISSGKYRTPAELACLTFKNNIRNRDGNYNHTFSRYDIQDELHLIFQKQREFGNKFATVELEDKVDKLLMQQRKSLSGDDILKIVGFCSLEENEYRSPKHTYSFEKFSLLTTLMNVRILNNKLEQKSLTNEQINKLILLAHKKAITYKTIRKELNLSDEDKFKGLLYSSKNDVENKKLPELQIYRDVAKILDEHYLLPNILDAIGIAFTLYKNEDEIVEYLENSVELSYQTIEELLPKLNYTGFVNLSLKAIKKLLPHLENGINYSNAVKTEYKDINKSNENVKKEFISSNDILIDIKSKTKIKNQTVVRSLSQIRKVINAIIKKYGTPEIIAIETATELGKSAKQRKEIHKKQEQNRLNNERAFEELKEQFPKQKSFNQKDVLKLKLFKQQNGICLYSGKYIDKSKLLDNNYVEVEHVVPYSRSFDDSQNNKILVLASENQNKKEKTPFEWLGTGEKWNNYVDRVSKCYFSLNKKEFLTKQEIDEKEFISRNLNDTRYITSHLVNVIKQYLICNQVVSVKGGFTANLRHKLGIEKTRENKRHHAVDAILVALSGMIFHNKEKYNWLMTNKEEIAKEIQTSVFSNNCIISQMTNHKVTGQAHYETIRSSKFLQDEYSTVRTPLTKIKIKDIEKILGYPDREPEFYKQLEEQLIKHNDNPEKAFANGFVKGNTVVKKVKLKSVQKSGVIVRKDENGNRHGIAKNASLIKIKIYRKNDKNYTIPVYAWQINKNIEPNSNDEFLFELFPNDMVSVDGEIMLYKSFDRSTGLCNFSKIDDASGINKRMSISKVDLKLVKVDVLGI